MEALELETLQYIQRFFWQENVWADIKVLVSIAENNFFVSIEIFQKKDVSCFFLLATKD